MNSIIYSILYCIALFMGFIGNLIGSIGNIFVSISMHIWDYAEDRQKTENWR